MTCPVCSAVLQIVWWIESEKNKTNSVKSSICVCVKAPSCNCYLKSETVAFLSTHMQGRAPPRVTSVDTRSVCY